MAERSKADILADIASAKHDFLTARLGKDVRSAMGDVAQGVYDALEHFDETPNFEGVLNIRDLNSVTPNAMYSLDFSRKTTSEPIEDYYQHKPTDATSASLLLCFGSSNVYYQIALCLHGDTYTRRYLAQRDEWSAWKGGIDATLSKTDVAADAAAVSTAITAAIATTTSFKGLLETSDESPTDVETIKGNASYVLAVHQVGTALNYLNVPDESTGIMLLVSYGTSDNGYHVLYGKNGSVYTRRLSGGTWEGDWSRIDAMHSISSNGADPTFTDLNEAPIGKTYQIKRNSHIANSPWGNGMSTGTGTYGNDYRNICGYPDGTVTTLGNTYYKHQIFIAGNRNGTTFAPTSDTTIFFRTYYNANNRDRPGEPGWGKWRCASDMRSPTSTNIAIRRRLIGRWLDENGLATNIKTDTLNEANYMVNYLAPWIDDHGTPVPINPDDEYEPNPDYIDDHTFFDDFDNAPLNSIYQIDKDCVAEVMKNNPRPEKSSILITTGFAWSGREHGKTQICVGVEDHKTFVYFRYGFEAAADFYDWSDWTEIPAVDSNLLTAGAAADAKAVGDTIYGERDRSTNRPKVMTLYGGTFSAFTDLPDWSTVSLNGTKFNALVSDDASSGPVPDADLIRPAGSYTLEKVAFLADQRLKKYSLRSIGGVQEWTGYQVGSSDTIHWYHSTERLKAAPRILIFGNSYSYSDLGLVPEILRLCGCRVQVGLLYISGGQIIDHIDRFNGDIPYDTTPREQSSGVKRSACYSYYDGSAWTNTNTDSTITSKSVLAETWDMIVMQVGTDANAIDAERFADMLIDTITYPVDFVANMSHGSGPNEFSPEVVEESGMTREELSNDRYLRRAHACRCLVESGDLISYATGEVTQYLQAQHFTAVLPTATAVQNARQIDSLKIYGEHNLGTLYGYLSHDTAGHLQNGIGTLIPAYVAALKLMDLLQEKHKLLGLVFKPDNDWLADTYNLYTAYRSSGADGHGSCEGVTDENILLAMKCAVLAYKNPYEITIMEETT